MEHLLSYYQTKENCNVIKIIKAFKKLNESLQEILRTINMPPIYSFSYLDQSVEIMLLNWLNLKYIQYLTTLR